MTERKPQEGDTLDLELDGKISLVQMDADGNEFSREELDGEVVLRVLLLAIDNSLDDFVSTLASVDQEKIDNPPK